MTKWLWKAWVQQHEDGQYPSPVLFWPTLCLLVNMRGGSYVEILSSDESSPSQALQLYVK